MTLNPVDRVNLLMSKQLKFATFFSYQGFRVSRYIFICHFSPTDAEVDRSIWWHFLVVHVPNEIDPALTNTGYLFIDGDANDNPDQTPSIDDPFLMLTGLISDGAKR